MESPYRKHIHNGVSFYDLAGPMYEGMVIGWEPTPDESISKLTRDHSPYCDQCNCLRHVLVLRPRKSKTDTVYRYLCPICGF